MHGFIFIEFEKFALSQVTYQEWYEILAENDLQDRQYTPIELYPDSELLNLVSSISERKARSKEKVLELFGMHVVPDLMKVYRAYVKPEWRTLDILEHAEKTIHTAVRISTAGAAPPILEVIKTSHNEITINYVSPRNMVEFGVGIIKGLAEFYNETANISIILNKNEAAGKSQITVRQLY